MSVMPSTVRRVNLAKSAARSRPQWREAKNLPRLAVSNSNSPSDTQVKCTARCLRWTPDGLGLWSRDFCHGMTSRHTPNHSMILLRLQHTALSKGDKQYIRAPIRASLPMIHWLRRFIERKRNSSVWSQHCWHLCDCLEPLVGICEEYEHNNPMYSCIQSAVLSGVRELVSGELIHFNNKF